VKTNVSLKADSKLESLKRNVKFATSNAFVDLTGADEDIIASEDDSSKEEAKDAVATAEPSKEMPAALSPEEERFVNSAQFLLENFDSLKSISEMLIIPSPVKQPSASVLLTYTLTDFKKYLSVTFPEDGFIWGFFSKMADALSAFTAVSSTDHWTVPNDFVPFSSFLLSLSVQIRVACVKERHTKDSASSSANAVFIVIARCISRSSQVSEWERQHASAPQWLEMVKVFDPASAKLFRPKVIFPFASADFFKAFQQAP
jgi:hypothetical protein